MAKTFGAHTAAAPAAGYLYQCRYALYLMLRDSRDRPDLEMSIERFDDVAFEKDGQPTDLLQTKHHLGDATPDLSDSSVDLWKTIRIWVAELKKHAAPPCFSIITTASASPGSAAALLRMGDGRDVNAALPLLERAAREGRSVATKPGREAFLALGSVDRRDLLNRVRVFDASPSILQVGDLMDRELAFAAPVGRVEAMRSRLEGWWFAEVVERLVGRTRSPLSAVDMRLMLDDLRESLRRDELPVDFRRARPSPDELDDSAVYVEQLRLIDAQQRTIEYAQTDFFRAFAQRSRWLDENLIALGRLEEYEDELVEEWDRERAWYHPDDAPSDFDEAAAAQQGQALYRVIQEKVVALRGCREPFVSRGSFHMLADRQLVGWHPRFEERLSAEGVVTDEPTKPAEQTVLAGVAGR